MRMYKSLRGWKTTFPTKMGVEEYFSTTVLVGKLVFHPQFGLENSFPPPVLVGKVVFHPRFGWNLVNTVILILLYTFAPKVVQQLSSRQKPIPDYGREWERAEDDGGEGFGEEMCGARITPNLHRATLHHPVKDGRIRLPAGLQQVSFPPGSPDGRKAIQPRPPTTHDQSWKCRAAKLS